LFRFVYVPSAFPIVLTAVRLSVGTAVAVLYFTEVTATYLGLGYYIFLMSGTLFDYAATYAGAIAMGLLGLCLYFLIDWLEKRLCRGNLQREVGARHSLRISGRFKSLLWTRYQSNWYPTRMPRPYD